MSVWFGVSNGELSYGGWVYPNNTGRFIANDFNSAAIPQRLRA